MGSLPGNTFNLSSHCRFYNSLGYISLYEMPRPMAKSNQVSCLSLQSTVTMHSPAACPLADKRLTLLRQDVFDADEMRRHHRLRQRVEGEVADIRALV